MFIKSANSIYHPKFEKFIIENDIFNELIKSGRVDYQNEFLKLYPEWIVSSKLNTVIGLDNFNHRYISLGVTQTLDWFHSWCFLNNKRIRMFKGEYPYNRDVTPFNYETDFITKDQPLKNGDAVIISNPFSATGDTHIDYYSLMMRCNQLNIPVMIDCAFFGTCHKVTLDFNYDCIHTVSFSTTKGLSTGAWRSGICFTKSGWGSLPVQTEWHHGIHLNVSIAYHLMKEFSPDTIPNDYLYYQQKVCNDYNLTPTKCMHLAIGDNDWKDYSRDGVCNRVGIKDAIKKYRKGDF